MVIIINSDINATISNCHLYQKSQNKIDDNLQDYIELINKLQHHMRYSFSYCICINKNQQIYRFGYLKDIINHIVIYDNHNKKPELITKRNNPYINPYDCLQL